MLISKLGLFDNTTIISNEDLQTIENFQVRDLMPLYPNELVESREHLSNSKNNDKSLNMALFEDEECSVYLTNEECSSTKNNNHLSTVLETIKQLNTLKY